ncbi:tripartite tricarboxylate transporter substrate binding protein [Brevibacillus sp. HB1.3]|uniref:Bug family tripartite tricarboxylate transporter substrate binding protein n=1 Tax=Brevibacillus sp. HB1.3 TaxID=2738842 RepID=UPI0015560449|nr:tripartite tricarboxylate transporter substrate binding protein [Brevibacillus sp. HB1.3]NQF16071.1 tripartite tricarboxylate transporter substrate binding protein [Brevibacillus sp. HB1.3]
MKKSNIWTKWSGVLLTTAMALSLAACGGGDGQTASSGGASTYPEKPISVIAPSGAGGGLDKTARSLAKVMSATKLVDKTISVENKPGGGQAVGLADFVTQDKKNNYKLLLPSTPIVINNVKKEGNSPHSYKDMTPLAQLTKDYGAIVVAADSPYKDLKSLMDAIKADPTKVTVAGGSAPGSLDHLTFLMPAVKAGIDPKSVKYISYDGGGEAIASLLGGNADVLATDVSGSGEYLKSGKVRILGVSSPERLKGMFKDIPTYKESGYETELINWRGVFGPKDMTPDAVAYWEQKLKAMTETPEWKAELEANGWDDGYKNGADFKSYLGEQEKMFKEILGLLGMAK